MTKDEHRHWRMLLAWPLVAAAVSLAVHAGFIVSALLFLGVPSIALAIWNPSAIRKSAAFAAALVPLGVSVDYIAHATGAWLSAPESSLRVFGVIPWEDIPWFFLLLFYVVMLWEYHLDRRPQKRPNHRRLWKLTTASILAFSIFVVLLLRLPNLLLVPYSYLWLTLFLGIVPAFLELSAHRNLAPKFVRAALYFAYMFFAYELVALQLDQWRFPGTQYIGWLQIGSMRFPLEELLTWGILLAPTMLSLYEHFADDER